MKVKINVTKTGIKKGEKFSCNHCPIARALKAKGFKNVSVGTLSVSAEYRRKWLNFTLPIFVQNFISKYDQGNKNFQPFSFTVTI